MKFVVGFLIVLVTRGNASPLLKNEVLIRANVTLDDVAYNFFPSGSAYISFPIQRNDIADIISYLDNTVPIVFLIPGHGHDETSRFLSALQHEIGNKYKVDVVTVDWSSYSYKNSFELAREAIWGVGQIVGELIKIFAIKQGIPYENINIIGYDLGAHIAGIAARELKGKIDSIIALDPANIEESLDVDDILSNSDAQYVQVIHTNIGHHGMDGCLGHAHFYLNGGITQPGCAWIPFISTRCDHFRAVTVYEESISSNNTFWATKCNSYSDFLKGKCKHYKNAALLGGFFPLKKVRGKYFLETNKRSPFSQGPQL